MQFRTEFFKKGQKMAVTGTPALNGKKVKSKTAQGSEMVGGTKIIPDMEYYAVLHRDASQKNAEQRMIAVETPGNGLMLCYIKHGKPSGGFVLSAFSRVRRAM